MDDVELKDNKQVLSHEDAPKWHFWFLVSFSLFLIITFVYYLPLRFLYMAMPDEKHMMDKGMMEDMSVGGDAHGGHSASVAHEEEDIVEGLANLLFVNRLPAQTGATTTLEFFVNLKPEGIAIPITSLEIQHEKLMHVIGVRSDMNEFLHIHPQPAFAPGELSVDYLFAKPGRYKIWSEIKKDGVVHTFAHPSIDVMGEGVREEKNVSFGRSVVVSGYQVVLAAGEPIGKGVDHDLYFDIHDEEGNEIAVEQYLGADMHLSLIKDDWSEFIHAHPVTSQTSGGMYPKDSGGYEMMEDAHTHSRRSVPEAYAHTGPTTEKKADDTINFRAVFPSAGLYRAYAQFRPKGTTLLPDEYLVALFWVRVEEQVVEKVSLQTQWWGLLFVSLIAMGALSWGVNRYLKGGIKS